MKPLQISKTNQLEKRLALNKKYNETIAIDLPSILMEGEILDGNVIVRLFKFEAAQDNDGKLLEPKWKAFETEGGKFAAKIENIEYSSRAIVIKKPSQEYIKALNSPYQEYRFNRLIEGTTKVWLSPGTANNDNYVFIEDRDFPVTQFNGFMSIPISAIQFIED